MNIQREDVVNLHDTHYVGKNIIVVGGGAINHKQLKKYVNNTFGQLIKEQEDINIHEN